MNNPWNNYSWVPKDEPNEPANDELLSSVRTDQESGSEMPTGSSTFGSAQDARDGGILALDSSVFRRDET
jgi:hypothetical protein